MKASAFADARATSLDGALNMLSAHREPAKLLAGGQSLVPAMNLRLVSPEVIIDISALARLRGITSGGGVLTLGALTRHVDIARSPEIVEVGHDVSPTLGSELGAKGAGEAGTGRGGGGLECGQRCAAGICDHSYGDSPYASGYSDGAGADLRGR